LRQVTASVISNKEVLPAPKVTHRSGRSILGVRLVWLDCPEIAREARPGQFVMVGCGEECVLRRPFSIHQVNSNAIALYFNVWQDGKGTQWLAQREAGDEIDLIGSLGNSYAIHPESHKLLLVAGGIGIASLRFLADEAAKQGLAVTLLCGTPTGDHRYPPVDHVSPPDLLPPDIEIITISEDGSAAQKGSVGRKGLVTDLLSDFAGGADQVFACGPVAMYREMSRMPELKGKSIQVSLEMRMGCGHGVCYGCTVRTKMGLKQVCRDGPVFTLDEVIWDELSPKI
jgi:dihydroorotate dehydrogenase electron transfer subunit